ncbi:MAG: glycosyltransferase [Candidatus Hodarchaeota archaeon]
MKILHVIPSYEPAWIFGGTVTATSQLCRALARKGVDVTVYTTDADGKGGHLYLPINRPIEVGGVKVWYFNCDFGVKKAFFSRHLSNKLKETITYFDLVHVSSIWQWMQQTVYYICKRKKIPYIVTPHSSLQKSSFYAVGPHLTKKLYWKYFGQRTIKAASGIHLLCKGERDESEIFLNFTPSFIVPNGIDINKYKYSENKKIQLRKSMKISNKAMVLLFLGRIHPIKQIELVIRSLPYIFQNRKEYFLIIAGPVEDKSYFKFLKKISNKLQLNENIIWKGPIDNTEVSSFYSASDILILPSKSEGISMTIIEAMASSLPVLISNRVANYYEVDIDKAGIVVQPYFESVREALIKIFTKPYLLKEMSQNARISTVKRYRIEKVASLMIKAYEDILYGRRSPDLQWK